MKEKEPKLATCDFCGFAGRELKEYGLAHVCLVCLKVQGKESTSPLSRCVVNHPPRFKTIEVKARLGEAALVGEKE